MQANHPQITTISHRSIKVDYRRLFALTSEEAKVDENRRQRASAYNNNGLAQILDGILNESGTAPKTVTSLKGRYIGPSDVYRSNSVDRISPSFLQNRLPEAEVSLSSMSEEEGLLYLSRGELPAHIQGEGDQMEWTPTQSKVTTFNPRPRQSNQPVTVPAPSDPRPFWFKLPPAPASAAHKLRNPPSQPQFFAPPQEEKENFFNSLTGRQSPFGTSQIDSRSGRTEMHMQQQKLFIPQEDLTTDLSDYMEKSFTLKAPATDSDVAGDVESNMAWNMDESRRTHLLSFIVLLCSFGAWNLAYSNQNMPTANITMGILGVCEAVALRSIVDHTSSNWAKRRPGFTATLATLLAGVEAAVAGVTMIEIWAGRGNTSNCQSLGAIVVGVMLVQELWFTLL
jgi:hypothetical protein